MHGRDLVNAIGNAQAAGHKTVQHHRKMRLLVVLQRWKILNVGDSLGAPRQLHVVDCSVESGL